MHRFMWWTTARRRIEFFEQVDADPGALVLIVSSSDSPHDREIIDSPGANEHFRKPSEFSEFMKLGPTVREMLSTDPSR
jgi:hypothetical protein